MPALYKYLESLSKGELEDVCRLVAIQPAESSTVSDLRRIIFQYFKMNPEELQKVPAFREGGAPKSPLVLDDIDPMTSVPSVQVTEPQPTKPTVSDANDITVMNALSAQSSLLMALTNMLSTQQNIGTQQTTDSNRHRNDKFLSRLSTVTKMWDGQETARSEAMIFIQAFEEYKNQFEPELTTVFAGLRDSLQGRAKSWFMANREKFSTYEEFRKEFLQNFLPYQHEFKIRDRIRSERQATDERLIDFQARLLNLNRQLQSPLDDDAILELLLNHSHPRYQLHFITLPGKNLANVLALAAAVEHAAEYEKNYNSLKEKKYSKSLAVMTKNPETTGFTKTKNLGPICLNCQEVGHVYKNCPKPLRLRCFNCQAPGKTVHTCDCGKRKVAATEMVENCQTITEPSTSPSMEISGEGHLND